MSTLNNILRKINTVKTLDFGTVFSDSIELFKRTWLQGLITIILTGVLAVPLGFIIYIPLVFLGIISPDSFEKPEPSGVAVLAIILTLLLAIVVLVLANALKVGLLSAYFRIMKIKDLGLNLSDDYLFFLKRKYLGKTINLGLIMVGIYLVAALMCILPVFYVIIPVHYMIVIYALNPDMPNKDIVKAGFALGNKKWFFTFGIVFISAILSLIVGFLMCFIGLYVTQQFAYTPFYLIYKEVIGLEDELDELNQIGLIEE